MFALTQTDETTHLRISLKGDITSATAPQADAALGAILATGRNRWILDLSELTFSSSAGLRVFLSYAKKLKNAQGRLVLAAFQPPVLEVFHVSGFTQIFTITSTVEEARRLFVS